LKNFKVYKYRWIVLLSMIPVLIVTQMFWLSFAPITGDAEKYYHVSPLGIALLSMSYMVVYIIMAIPASWLVDTKGFRIAMGFGAIITAVFGMMRGLFASNFTIVVIAQIGVAIGQPFLMNSTTKAAAKWFPVNERATAIGITSMAGYIGMVIALILTPLLANSYGIANMLMIYGYVAVGCAVIFLAFSRERPETPPGQEEVIITKLNFKDVKTILYNKNFVYLSISFFVIMGVFNAIMTWIEDMLRPKGISPEQAGLIGGSMVVVGLIGAILLPALSDKMRNRRSFLVWPIVGAIPGLVGLTFFSDFTLLMISAAIMGFFIMGMGPVAFQYGTEIAYPIPEGTSYGILMMMGQISGIIFICFMNVLRTPSTGAMTLSMVILTVMVAASLLVIVRLKESRLITENKQEANSEVQQPASDFDRK